jgi:translocation and assembly module TamA
VAELHPAARNLANYSWESLSRSADPLSSPKQKISGASKNMGKLLRRTLRPAAVALVLFHPAAPALAFDLFGLHLWGEREDETQGRIEIEDPLNYSVTIQAPDDVRSTVESASALWRDEDAPAAGKAGLLSKGRGDYRRILGALYNEGYFGTGISIRVGGQEVSDLTLSADIPDNSAVTISVDPGSAFHFGQTQIVNAPPLVVEDNEEFEPPSSVGFEPGAEAKTSAIDAASSLTVNQWRQLSRAKAREDSRDVVADHPRKALDVSVTLDPGPEVRYGTVSNSGSQHVDPEFINYMIDLPKGDPYDPDDVDKARSRLSNLAVFDSIRFQESDAVGPDGLMPISVTLKDRKRRGLGVGGTYSTIDGLGLSAYWLHRNLFGRAESLRFDASIEGLISSSNWDEYDYNFGVTFTKPGTITPDTDFIASLEASQSDYETYRERALTGLAGFSHQFTNTLSGELYGRISKSRYEDDFGDRDFFTFGLVGRATEDRRDNALDATRGFYLSAEAIPYFEAEYGNLAARGTIDGRIYHGFGETKNFVMAARAKVGSFVGSSVEESPPDMLFFAGGGGSVRGYAYNSIGVDSTNADGEEIVSGGKSLAEGSLELRYRFGTSNYGAVAFVDAGLVNPSSDFMDTGDVAVGTGLGARYYTSFGPLRVDVAVPLDKPEDGDSFGVYIGIGQAF